MSEFMRQLPTAFRGMGDHGKISSKRVVTFLLAITLVIITLGSTFFGFEIDPVVFDGIVNVLIWSLGFVGSEQFAGALKTRYTRGNNPESNLPPKPGGEDREQF